MQLPVTIRFSNANGAPITVDAANLQKVSKRDAKLLLAQAELSREPPQGFSDADWIDLWGNLLDAHPDCEPSDDLSIFRGIDHDCDN